MTREERLMRIMRKWAAVEAVLATMPPDKAALVRAYYLGGLDWAAFAKQQKCSQVRIRQKLKVALQRIEDMLLEDNPA